MNMEHIDMTTYTMQVVMAMSSVYVMYLVILGVQCMIPRGYGISKGDGNLWTMSNLVRSQWLSTLFGAANVHLKMESMQPSGSMAVRGISQFMKGQLAENELIDTFVASSCCDGTLAMAHCAKQFDRKSLVILDETERENPMVTILRKEFNAEVVFKGLTRGDADKFAQSAAADSDKVVFVPMGDDSKMALCHQAIVTELTAQLSSPPDCIVCPVVGDGNLLLGMMTGLTFERWTGITQIVAAQSTKSALRYGTIKNTAVRPSGGGIDLGHRPYGKTALKFLGDFERTGNAVETFVVNEEAAKNTATLFGLREKVMINEEAATAVAAMLQNKAYFEKFNDIVVIISSGNLVHFDQEMLERAQEDGTFDENGNYAQSTEDALDTTLDEEESDFYDSEIEEF